MDNLQDVSVLNHLKTVQAHNEINFDWLKCLIFVEEIEIKILFSMWI